MNLSTGGYPFAVRRCWANHHAGGVAAIGRWLSEATPPVSESRVRHPDRGSSHRGASGRFRALLLAFCLGIFVPAASAWPGAKFTEVRAYAWPATLKADRLIADNGQLAPGVLNPEGVILSKAQVRRLLAAEARRIGRVKYRPMCYRPHNAFVFRGAGGRTVAFIEICFDCAEIRLRPKDERSNPDFEVLARIFMELNLPTGNATLERLRDRERERREQERGL